MRLQFSDTRPYGFCAFCPPRLAFTRFQLGFKRGDFCPLLVGHRRKLLPNNMPAPPAIPFHMALFAFARA
ncbi:hypothetical protein ACG9ZE_22685, partial [Acinetobacter sp. ULE_I053]|uniref:hypothetical protein n=1 Tax=Acinetobacter sp. ULE_I053 TaxID=3373069 RepID=UPI003AF65F61